VGKGASQKIAEPLLQGETIQSDNFPSFNDVRLFNSVAAIPQHVWDNLFPGAAEDWAYYRAIESCPPGNFRFAVIAVLGSDRILAAAPIFRTSYELHTSLQGRTRRFADRLARRVPRLLRLPVMVLGSPLLDRCDIGVDPGVKHGQRSALLQALLDGLQEHAAKERITLLGLKDVSNRDSQEFHSVFASRGFARIANVPIAYIDLPSNEEAYLASLPKKTANYLRRKFKTLPRLKVDYRDSAAGLEQELHALYEATRINSKVQYGDFDQLHPHYFQAVLESCKGNSQLILCWSGDALVSFLLCMVGKHEVVPKYVGMRYPDARELNLYFINCLMLFRFAFEQGIKRVRLGSTSYNVKLLLGANLEKSWIYFRHLNPVVNWVFHRLAPLMDYEKNDPELRKLTQGQ
jgi:Acetyltransferase (GNAT) domain